MELRNAVLTLLLSLQQPHGSEIHINPGGRMLRIDLSVNASNPLYAGLGVTEVGGRFNLPNAMSADVLNAIGKTVAGMIEAVADRDECILTGPAPVQVYLVVFHGVVHRFRKVQYLDGRNESCTVAQHG
jgi:hypothetical protein